MLNQQTKRAYQGLRLIALMPITDEGICAESQKMPVTVQATGQEVITKEASDLGGEFGGLTWVGDGE